MGKFLSIILWFSTITLLVACPNANSNISQVFHLRREFIELQYLCLQIFAFTSDLVPTCLWMIRILSIDTSCAILSTSLYQALGCYFSCLCLQKLHNKYNITHIIKCMRALHSLNNALYDVTQVHTYWLSICINAQRFKWTNSGSCMVVSYIVLITYSCYHENTTHLFIQIQDLCSNSILHNFTFKFISNFSFYAPLLFLYWSETSLG